MEIARVTAWDPTYFVAYRDLVAFYEVDVTLIGFTVVNPLECATLIHFAPHNFALPLLPAPVRLDAPLCRVVSAENFIAFAHALLNLLCQLLHCRYSVYRLYNSLSLSIYISTINQTGLILVIHHQKPLHAVLQRHLRRRQKRSSSGWTPRKRRPVSPTKPRMIWGFSFHYIQHIPK
jgi:hypothetical protein